ncbi:MAG: AsmA family protein, partial [Gammaproteobacteria bacterium]|nr:AsmA family protein [Gammaproteobacteria bacterium]
MRLKRTLTALSVLILLPVLLLTAVLVFLDAADLSKHREFIADQVSTLAGRRLILDGELDLNLGRTTSVRITDIALANASWASEPEMLSIERVEASIELLPLLRGDIHIPRLHVHRVQSRIETSQEGVGNWVMAQQPVDDVPTVDRGPADLKLPWLGDVQLSEIEVIYLDGQTGQRVSTVLDHVRLGADTPQMPTEIDVKGRVNDEPVEINGKIAIPARLATDRMEFPLELHARVLDIEAEASGRISGELESPAIALDVDVNAADLDQLRQVFGDAVPLVDNVSLAMEVEGEQGQPVTMKLDAVASDAKLDTQLTLHRDGPRPRLVASLDLAGLDVVRMWASYFSDKPAQEKAAEPVTAQPAQPKQLDKPIALDWLGAFDADIVIAAKDINLPQMRISHFQSHIMIDDRRLTVEDTKLDTDAGSVVAKLSLDDRNKQPDINLALDTTDVALDSIKALADN